MNGEQLRQVLSSPAAFRQAIIVDVDGEPRRLGDVMDPWQRTDFEALDGAWLRVTGRDATAEGPARAYLERPRGHSKTTDIAAMVTWALAASSRMLAGVCAAADKDQARLIRDAIERLLRLNPWLSTLIEVQAYRVINLHTGSACEILSSDAATSYGLTPDFIVCDELTHWLKIDLWESLFSAAAKRKNCVLIVISNAGVGQGTSWQWTTVREAARELAGWYFSRIDGPIASWITPDRLDEQRRLLPPKAFARLWLNLWQVECGDALDMEDVARCTVLPGPPEPFQFDYLHYFASLDLGLKHDHSALVVLCADILRQQLKLCSVESWAPPRGGKVDVNKVMKAVLDAGEYWGISNCIYDPWQCDFLASKIAEADPQIQMVEFVPSPANLDEAATAVLQAFRNEQIELYPCKPLERDLAALSIVAKPNGQFKLIADRSRDTGHADRAFALAAGLARGLPFMRELRNSRELQNF